MDAVLLEARQWLDSHSALSGPPHGLDPEVDPQYALDHLARIQDVVPPKQDMISIPLDDMKVLTGLMKVIVCYGLWVYSEPGSLRNLPDRTPWVLPPQQPNLVTLESLTEKLTDVLMKKDDVADIIGISPFMVDVLAASIPFPPLFKRVRDQTTTYRLYGFLTSLIRPGRAGAVISRTLSLMPLDRKDAVRSMLEIVTRYREQEEQDLAQIGKAVQPFARVPRGVDPARFASAISLQIWTLLTRQSELALAAAILAGLLSAQNAEIVAPLRTTICNPFTEADLDAEPALIALTRLADRQQHSPLFSSISAQLAVPLWLLLVTVHQEHKPNASTFNVVSKCVSLDMLAHIMVTDWQGMVWDIRDGIKLQEKVGPHKILGIDEMQTRLELLVAVLDHVDDSTVTELIVNLVRRYTVREGDMLATAQILQRVTQDQKLRRKMFGNPVHIVKLALEMLSPKPQSLTGSVESVDIGDSDDEDGDSDGDENDDDLVELSLSLLSGAIMEAGTSPEILTLVQESRDLTRLSKSTNLALRDKAEFSLQLAKGLKGELSIENEEIEWSNPQNVLKTARISLADPAVPTRAHGLYLVAQLVQRSSIGMQEALNIFLHELGDPDSFVYLNAIKGLESCASAFGSSTVLKSLLATVSQAKTSDVDRALRIREAVTQIVQKSPSLSSEVVHTLTTYILRDLRTKDAADYHLRLSSISMLGWVIGEYANSLQSWQETEVVDVAQGILTHETNDAPMKRGALVLIQTLIVVLGEGGFSSLSVSRVQSLIDQAAKFTNDDDETVREHARHITALARELRGNYTIELH